MDTVYPEAMSRLHKGISANLVENNLQNFKRKTKKQMDRKGRFRTQPITFMEIQEVDEDSAELSISGGATSGLPSVQIIGGGSDDHGLSQQGNQDGSNLCSGLTPPSTTITKARSEMDLKYSQEDLTRSYRRPRKKHLELPRCSPPPPSRIMIRESENLRPESPLEEAETADQVCRLVAPILMTNSGLHLHQHSMIRSSPDIEFPPAIIAKSHAGHV